MTKNKLGRGASADAILLMLIKLVTILVSFAVTRLLSEYLTVYDYGTYSQILLIVSTVSSLTILGMVDGVNYFYCSEQDTQRRESYISTIFALQCIVSTAAGFLVLLLSKPLSTHFDNPDIGRLLVFAAALPLFQNLLSMFQVLLVSVGKARMLAIRNLTVSLVRLAAVILVVTLVRNVAVILTASLLLDVGQILFFGAVLQKEGCRILARRVDFRLLKRIFGYCAPMAVFTAINALNRDLDKYLITLCTDTETMAVYSNASKALPFDIIMTSFCTVLLPEITRLVAAKDHRTAVSLYRVFLEIAYISTAVLCCAALTAAPQLMRLLYSDKYMSGLDVFRIYILVDLLRFTNMTLILSAAGKTKTIMFLGFGSIAVNAVLNVLMFRWMGVSGPAAATFLTILGTGVLMMHLSAKELGVKIYQFFDLKYLLLFLAESLLLTLLFARLQTWMAGKGIHYLAILVVICGCYCGCMLLLHGKRILSALKKVNQIAKK